MVSEEVGEEEEDLAPLWATARGQDCQEAGDGSCRTIRHTTHLITHITAIHIIQHTIRGMAVHTILGGEMFGMGWGWRRGYGYGYGYPPYQPYYPAYQPSIEQEISMMEQQLAIIEQQLEAIKRRIEEIKRNK